MAEKSEGVVELYDIRGRRVFVDSIDNTRFRNTFNISNQPDGIYFVSVIMNNGQTFSKKLVINQ